MRFISPQTGVSLCQSDPLKFELTTLKIGCRLHTSVHLKIIGIVYCYSIKILKTEIKKLLQQALKTCTKFYTIRMIYFLVFKFIRKIEASTKP